MDLFTSDDLSLKSPNNYKTNYTYIYNQKMFNDNFDKIMTLKEWVCDTETTGLDFLTDQVTLLQVGNQNVQYVIDTRYVEINRLNERFEDEYFSKLLVNGTFDYLMLRGSKNIVMEGMFDVYLAEKVLTAGYTKHGYGMAGTGKKYLGIDIDKEMQKTFIGHTGPYSRRQLNYAALDCVYPFYIFKEQVKLLRKWNLWEAFMIECNSIPAFGDIAYFGMKLNRKKWEDNITTARTMSEISARNFLLESAKHSNIDLFGMASINMNSPQQMLEYLKGRFSISDLKDRDGKVGTGEEILSGLVEKYGKEKTIDVQEVLKVRGYEKKIGTYGLTYTDHIHESDQRFHPRIEQLATETGRPAGKKPNMLNIPSSPSYRDPWEAGEGRKVLNDDYGACELRVMASLSGDPVMCEGFRSGKDFHTYTASQFVKDNEPFMRELIPDEHGEAGKNTYGDYVLDSKGNKQPNPYLGIPMPYERVLKDIRSAAKAINFGLAYGMGPAALAARLGITMDLAKEYIKQYNQTFAVLVAWLDSQRQLALRPRAYRELDLKISKASGKKLSNTLGYSETPSGRKRFYLLPIIPDEVKYANSFVKSFGNDKSISWVSRKLGLTLLFDPANPWDKKLKQLYEKEDAVAVRVKKYHARIASIQREGGNAPIQGTNADMTKIAMYEFRKYIRKYEKDHNDGKYLAHIMLQVYDEILVDSPEHLAQKFGDQLTKCMVDAGNLFIKNVPVEASCVAADTWVH